MIRKDVIDRFSVPPREGVRLKDYPTGWKQGGEFEELGQDAVKGRSAITGLDLRYPEVTNEQKDRLAAARRQLPAEGS